MVVAPKKDSDDVRLCVDFSKLNKYVLREYYQSCSPAEAVFPLSRFFQRVGDLLEQGQINFGNVVSIALENSTNLRKYDFWYTLILDWYKI